MLIKLVLLFSLSSFISLTVSAPAVEGLILPKHIDSDTRGIDMKLVSEYKQDRLEALSADGRLLLMFHSNKPVRSYTIPIDGTRAVAKQSPPFDDRLRVVDRGTGREVGSIPIDFFAVNKSFVLETARIFYSEPKRDSTPGWQSKLWDPASGEIRICLDAPDGKIPGVFFLNNQWSFALVSNENGGALLAKFNVTGCVLKHLGPIDPNNPRKQTWGNLALSRDGRFLAYSNGEQVLIRDLENNQVVRRLTAEPSFFKGTLAFTPDDKTLVAVTCARGCSDSDAESKNHLWFYNTSDYKKARELEVPKLTALKISPDSRLFAIAYKEEKQRALWRTEQGTIVLYDFLTGEQLARASHPSVKQRRDNPRAAEVSSLAFTPDGKYLISSTNDTRVWQIDGRKQ